MVKKVVKRKLDIDKGKNEELSQITEESQKSSILSSSKGDNVQPITHLKSGTNSVRGSEHNARKIII